MHSVVCEFRLLIMADFEISEIIWRPFRFLGKQDRDYFRMLLRVLVVPQKLSEQTWRTKVDERFVFWGLINFSLSTGSHKIIFSYQDRRQGKIETPLGK